MLTDIDRMKMDQATPENTLYDDGDHERLESMSKCPIDDEEMSNDGFWKKLRSFLIVVAVSSIFCLSFLVTTASKSKINTTDQQPKFNRRLQQQVIGRSLDANSQIRLSIYSTSSTSSGHTDAVGRKHKHDMEQASKNNIDSYVQVESIDYLVSQKEQGDFVLENCGQEIFQRMGELYKTKPHFANEIFKWCTLSTATHEKSSSNAVLFLDAGSPIVLNYQYSNFIAYLNEHVLKYNDNNHLPNVAVLGMDMFPDTIHGSLLLLRNTPTNHELTKSMLQILLKTDITFEAIEANALLLSKSLFTLIQQQKKNGDWYFLEQQCRMEAPRRLQENSASLPHIACPTSSGYCCSIQDRHGIPLTVLVSQHPILPYQTLDQSNILVPFNHRNAKASASVVGIDELPFISTVVESVIPKPRDFGVTPTFYEMLSAKRCLPADDRCSKCLREKQGANCHSCGSFCHCFCKALCNPDDRPHSHHVAKKLIVTPPAYKRDPTRLIPRIVHQTWFEELTTSKYPNMSRLVQSFVLSGWEYKFYSDSQAQDFLSTHFPKEVRETYDTLRPGAFKADLFRYCVLLIHGGVYADVDIQLETALDLAIAPDIGFMVPIDEPGKPVHKQMCLWNGFIASAPGHPFLAKAIETIVNQVRNRFTSVDIDETFCEYHDDRDKIKSPELSVLHAYDTLFTAGPCLLGSSINRVLGRPGQTSFHPGELKGIWDEKHRSKVEQGSSFVMGIPSGAKGEHYKNARIPGRIVILHQNKWDMGAHRFTMVEENLVVAATDLPDSNDRATAAEEVVEGVKTDKVAHEHYSKAHAKTGVYGVENLYTNRIIAHENIQIFVDASRLSKSLIQPSVLLS